VKWLAIPMIGVAGAVFAHSGATGIVKERMDGMKDMSNATKALGAIKAGVLPYSPDIIRRAAGQLRDSARAAKSQFPAGSDGHPSEALQTIWEDQAGFDQLLDDLIAASARLDAGAENRDDALRAADDVAKTCKDCHAKYRAKKI